MMQMWNLHSQSARWPTCLPVWMPASCVGKTGTAESQALSGMVAL